MTDMKKGAGVVPASADRADQERYQTGKGCLSLVLVILVFLIVSVGAAILTGL
ncbi:MAG: hypothetical protein ACF8MF_03410 [Phycisphaerales bacterium JB052]